MTDPRLHHLARQAVSRISLGHDPERAIFDALSLATAGEVMEGVYEQLAPQARSICLTLWGEKPMRAVDIVRFTGAPLRSTNDCLMRLMRAGYVRRVRHGFYAIQVPGLRPVNPKPLDYYRPGDQRIETRRAKKREYRRLWRERMRQKRGAA